MYWYRLQIKWDYKNNINRTGRFLRLRMEERPPAKEGSYEYIE
jgi:hypothetical protein